MSRLISSSVRLSNSFSGSNGGGGRSGTSGKASASSSEGLAVEGSAGGGAGASGSTGGAFRTHAEPNNTARMMERITQGPLPNRIKKSGSKIFTLASLI